MKQAGSGPSAPRVNRYDDVQVELAALCFDRLMPTLISSGATVVLVCGVLAVHYRSQWFLQMAVTVTVLWVLRMAVPFRFPADRISEMTATSAARWEDLYGYVTILYVTGAAVVTMSTMHQKDSIGVGLTTLGTFAFINGIGARVSVRPAVAKLSGLILMSGLAIALLGARELITRCSVGFLVLYAYIYCESIQIKYEVLVEQLRLKRKMSDLAAHDVLTGLANRRGFYTRLAAACAEPGSFALLSMDLDGFKKVNDTLGHAAGDALLQQVATRLQAAVATGLIARLGGDEFSVLHRSMGGRSPEEIANGINLAMAHPFIIDGHSVKVGVSIGVQLSEPPHADPDTLLGRADEALYRVKRAGGGGFRFAEPSYAESITGSQHFLPAAMEQTSGRGQDSGHRLGKLLAGIGEQQANLPHLGVG